MCTSRADRASRTDSDVERSTFETPEAKIYLSGIYLSSEQVVTIRVMMPKIGATDFHTNIELLVDNRRVAEQRVGAGDFRLMAPVPKGSGIRRVGVHFSATRNCLAETAGSSEPGSNLSASNRRVR